LLTDNTKLQVNAALERNGAAEMDEIVKAGGICAQKFRRPTNHDKSLAGISRKRSS
jgi:hypothetical protein